MIALIVAFVIFPMAGVDVIRHLINEKQYWLKIELGYIPDIWLKRERFFNRWANINYAVAFCSIAVTYIFFIQGMG